MMHVRDSAAELEELIRARYTLLYVVSSEEERVERAIVDIAEQRGRLLWFWSVTEGFRGADGTDIDAEVRDPLRALDRIVGQTEQDAIVVLRDFHPYLGDPAVVRRLRDANRTFRKGRLLRHVIILSPTLRTPPELEKEMAVVDYALPGREDVDRLISTAMRSVPRESLRVRDDTAERERVVEAALGLTADEISNVFARSLVRTKELDIDTILEEKKHIIRKSGILEFYESDARLADIGGLDALKEWLTKRQLAFSSKARDFGLPVPKGILLIGVPGCGKSLTAKAVGAFWKMPLLRLDVGAVFSSLVGSSEENIRRAIGTAEAVAPSILWLDELEKGFSGTQSSGQSDAGTTARVFASFITWLQEKTSPVFVIATANDVSLLPPELLRKGRFDEVFFVDLPSSEERRKILSIHIRKKRRDPASFDLDALVSATAGFSGSEIEQCVVSALYDAFMDETDIDTARLTRSIGEVIPLSRTMKESIEGMRDWARSRARGASAVVTTDENEDVRELEL